MSNQSASTFGCLVSLRPGEVVGYNGLRQANDDFLKAIIRYSHFSELHLFLVQGDIPGFQELWSDYIASYGSDKNIRLLPVHLLPTYLESCEYSVFHCGDPYISDLASLREHHSRKLFPITGRAHTLSDDCRLSRMRDLIMSPVKSCDAVLCSSTAQKQVMMRLLASASAGISDTLSVAIPFRGQIELVPLGIEPEGGISVDRESARAELGYMSGCPVILCLGRLSPSDKMDLHPLLYALNDLLESRRIKDFQLVIAGAGDASDEYVRSLLRHCYELNLEDQVRFELSVDDHRKSLLLKAADLFVSIADNVQESFGLAPLEAMKEGVPVVLSDWNGYRDLVENGDSGFLVETLSADSDDISQSAGLLHPFHARLVEAQSTAIDVDSLADVLEQLVNDEALRSQTGLRGRHRVRERFAWPVLMEQYHGLVSDLGNKAARIRHRPGRPVGLSFRNVFGHYATSELTDSASLQASDRGIRVLLGSERGGFFSELGHVLDEQLICKIISAAIKPVSVAEVISRFPELPNPEFVLTWMMKYQLLEHSQPKGVFSARKALLPELFSDEAALAAIAGTLQFPEEKRSVFLRPVLATSFVVLSDAVAKLDRSGGELLTVLAQQLLALMDERLLQAIGWYGEERDIAAYGEIIQQLEDEGGLDRLRQLYPLWLRNSRREVFAFLGMVRAVFRRLGNDLDKINRAFSGDWKCGAKGVAGIDFADGISRRSAVILSLNNGEKLVYKSRDLRIDRLLLGEADSVAAKVNGWLNGFPGLGTIGLLPMKEQVANRVFRYGYSAYVSSSPEGLSFSSQEAVRYHQHLGVTIGFALMLGLSDLHHLNIHCRDGAPCIVDVETAFHGAVFRQLERELQNPVAGFARGVEESSLAQTGMTHLWESFHTTRVSHCSVRLVNGELLEAEPFEWLAAAKNLLSVADRHSLDGIHPAVPGLYLDEMMAGFEKFLGVLTEHRDEWVGLLQQAASLEVRYQPLLNLNDAQKQLRDLYVSPVFQVLPDERLAEYFQRLARRITMAGEVGQRWLDEGWKEPVGCLSEVWADSWLKMSQPVFVRLPGTSEVFVRRSEGDRQELSEEQSGSPYFQQDIIGMAVAITDLLAGDPALRQSFVAAYRQMLDSWLTGQILPDARMPETLKNDLLSKINR